MNTKHESTDQGGLGGVWIDQSSCATVSLAQAAQILGVHRSTVWDLYRRGEFPIPVLRIGSRLRVSKVHLERFLLGVDGAA